MLTTVKRSLPRRPSAAGVRHKREAAGGHKQDRADRNGPRRDPGPEYRREHHRRPSVLAQPGAGRLAVLPTIDGAAAPRDGWPLPGLRRCQSRPPGTPRVGPPRRAVWAPRLVGEGRQRCHPPPQPERRVTALGTAGRCRNGGRQRPTGDGGELMGVEVRTYSVADFADDFLGGDVGVNLIGAGPAAAEVGERTDAETLAS